MYSTTLWLAFLTNIQQERALEHMFNTSMLAMPTRIHQKLQKYKIYAFSTCSRYLYRGAPPYLAFRKYCWHFKDMNCEYMQETTMSWWVNKVLNKSESIWLVSKVSYRGPWNFALKTGRPRCYAKSPTLQDAIPGLHSHTGVTGRWGQVSHARKAVLSLSTWP